MHGSWYRESDDRVAAPLRDFLISVGGVGWLWLCLTLAALASPAAVAPMDGAGDGEALSGR